jgi:hypothetical protein
MTKDEADEKDKPRRPAIEQHDRFGFDSSFVKRDPFLDWDYRTNIRKSVGGRS